MPRRDTHMFADPIDVLAWRTAKVHPSIPFEWLGYEADHDLDELVQHGLHGRRPSDDRPLTSRERARLVADERRDLLIHASSLKETGEDKPDRPTPKRKRKRGLMAAVRQMSPEEKAAMRRMWEAEP